ncbi:MAG: hypothetical protein C3F13_07190 [Anaerolineales bacterium]|nr:YIP1 family protein [Anaerolineae bacterium]PWB54069.1 MAG: hypothetical protein C3F13_07190 [Anaerolineales bacterium]
MYSREKLLEMLTSNKPSVRYEACEWIRVSQESSPEIVIALEKATHDVDKEVTERATLALQADVHHQMAIQIGMIEPDTDSDQEKNMQATNILDFSEAQLYQVDSAGFTEGMVSAPPKHMNILETWFTAIKPSQSNFAEILNDPKASTRRGLLWFFLGTMISSLIDLLVMMFNGSFQSNNMTLFGTSNSVILMALYALIIIASNAIFLISPYLVMAGGTNIIARVFMKQGDFGRLVYLTSAFTAPMILLYTISRYIGRFGWPPFAILIYELVSWGAAIIAVYNIRTGKAILITIVAGIITISSIFIFVIILGLLAVRLGFVS